MFMMMMMIHCVTIDTAAGMRYHCVPSPPHKKTVDVFHHTLKKKTLSAIRVDCLSCVAELAKANQAQRVAEDAAVRTGFLLLISSSY
jgi:hypothetical protein